MSRRACAYQGVRNVSVSNYFTYVLNGWPISSPTTGKYGTDEFGANQQTFWKIAILRKIL